MKKLLTAAALAVAPLMLAGCAGGDYFSLLSEVGVEPAEAIEKAEKVEDTVLGNMVKPLPIYCKAPDTARSFLRDRINARPEAGGAQVAVWCPGDPPLTLGPS